METISLQARISNNNASEMRRALAGPLHTPTPTRVALAWLMVQPAVTAPIASATSDKHLTDPIEATRLKLDHASIEKLNTVSTPAAAVKGLCF
jgi:aryl-alcohol dehydrogenase-like predicted oxidoreductase